MSGDPALLRAIAGHGLAGGRPTSWPPRPLGEPEWDHLESGVHAERMEGLLAAAVGDGALPVTDAQRERVRHAARGRASVDLLLERQLLETASRLSRAGIDFRVLKGPAFAHLVYPDPAWRGSGDVDLLIGGEQWESTVGLLQRAGAARTIPELRPHFDRRFGKEATLVAPAGWQLDLHRTLVLGPYGLWVDAERLWSGVARLRIGATELPALPPETAFVHACLNASVADATPRLLAVRDVAQFLSGGAVDPDVVDGLARRWHAEAVVAAAVARATCLFGAGVTTDARWRRWATRRPRTVERILMATYRGPAPGYSSQLAGVVALRGARAKLAYLGALAWPQPDYRRARGWKPLTHAAVAARRLVHRAAGR
jgi:hypothetical protein